MNNLYVKESDIIVYMNCNKWYKNKELRSEWLFPWTIQSSLTKLLRMWYIDGDYKVIKEMKSDDVKIKIWERHYITYWEVKKEVQAYKWLFYKYWIEY